MKHLLCIILSLAVALGAYADQLPSPELPEAAPPAATTPYERTPFQKGIGISTDVIAIAMPAATLAGVLILQDWQGLKQAAFTAVTAGGLTLILKYSIKEWRPDYSNHHSFPSMHSATAFATAAFLQRRYGWKFGGPAYALATYTAVGRVLAKKHHWWDCVAGAAIGAGSAYIYTRPWARKHELSIMPAASDTHVGFVASMVF